MTLHYVSVQIFEFRRMIDCAYFITTMRCDMSMMFNLTQLTTEPYMPPDMPPWKLRDSGSQDLGEITIHDIAPKLQQQ